MKRNLVGKILGKIKIFVQDFVPIRTALMGLKSAHSQEYDFQESGEVDKFLKMGTHFHERSGSLENGLCVTWSGFWLCPAYLWRLILVAVEQTYVQIPRRLVAQRVAPAARVVLSQTQAFGNRGYWWKRWRTGSRYRCRCHVGTTGPI